MVELCFWFSSPIVFVQFNTTSVQLISIEIHEKIMGRTQ